MNRNYFGQDNHIVWLTVFETAQMYVCKRHVTFPVMRDSWAMKTASCPVNCRQHCSRSWKRRKISWDRRMEPDLEVSRLTWALWYRRVLCGSSLSWWATILSTCWSPPTEAGRSSVTASANLTPPVESASSCSSSWILRCLLALFRTKSYAREEEEVSLRSEWPSIWIRTLSQSQAVWTNSSKDWETRWSSYRWNENTPWLLNERLCDYKQKTCCCWTCWGNECRWDSSLDVNGTVKTTFTF